MNKQAAQKARALIQKSYSANENNGVITHHYNLRRKKLEDKHILLLVQHIDQQSISEDSVLEINLSDDLLDFNAFINLAKAKLPQLSLLQIYGNNLGEKGCELICKADWKNLKAINLTKNKIGIQGCHHLSQGAQIWSKLESISLAYNAIGDKGCKYLARSEWSHLRELYLNQNEIGKIGCQHLSKSTWKQLRYLYIYSNSMQDQGCKYISKSCWNNLQTINASYNEISDAGYRELLKSAFDKVDLSGETYMSKHYYQKLIEKNWNVMCIFTFNSPIDDD